MRWENKQGENSVLIATAFIINIFFSHNWTNENKSQEDEETCPNFEEWRRQLEQYYHSELETVETADDVFK